MPEPTGSTGCDSISPPHSEEGSESPRSIPGARGQLRTGCLPSIKSTVLRLSRIRPRCLVRAAFLPGPALAAGLGARQRFPKQIFAQCNNTWERAGAFASPAPGGGSRGAGLGPWGFSHALTCRRAELPRFRTSSCSAGLHKEAFNLHPSKGASLSAGPGKPHWAPGHGRSGRTWAVPVPGSAGALPCRLCRRCSKLLWSPSSLNLPQNPSVYEVEQRCAVAAPSCQSGALHIGRRTPFLAGAIGHAVAVPHSPP